MAAVIIGYRFIWINLSRKCWSEDCVICVDDWMRWWVVVVSVTVTTVVDVVDAPPTDCCCEWETTASKNVARRRRTRTRHFWVDSREFGFTINEAVVVDFCPRWLDVLLPSWCGWAIRRTKLGRRRTAEPATRDGQRSIKTSRIISESNLFTTQLHHHHHHGTI